MNRTITDEVKHRMSLDTGSPSPRKKQKTKDPTPSTSRKDNSLRDALECTICLEFAISPIQNCKNGHIVCGSCVGHLPGKKCPTCQAKLGLSVLGERMAKQLEHQMDCDYAEDGCKEHVKSTDFKKHIANCCYRNIECPKTGCGDKVTMRQFPAHLKTKHSSIPFIFRKTSKSGNVYSVKIPKDAGSSVIFYKIVDFDGNTFIFSWTRLKTAFLASISILGGVEEARKYRYKLKPKSQNKSAIRISVEWTLPVMPFHEVNSLGFKKPAAFFASIPIATLESFCKPGPSTSLHSFKAHFALDILTT